MKTSVLTLHQGQHFMKAGKNPAFELRDQKHSVITDA